MAVDFTTVLRNELARGTTLDSALVMLREQGASIIDSIKCVREVKSVSLGHAKQLVSGSPAWDDIRESHAKFIEELIHSLDAGA
jgi:ribosomal protein L7/L12